MNKSYTTGFFLFLAASIFGQLPNTDLYMLTMLNNGERIALKDPIYLSGFNPDGYNNQPFFINPKELYISSDLYDKTFTDFVKLDIQNEKYYRVTATDSISEYSPTPRALPGFFSAVRVEKDGRTQSLWLYPEDHSSYGKRVLTELSNIGYHCWLSEIEVALFLVDTPMKLAIGNIADNSSRIIIENIGRCFRQDENGNLLFIHKITDESWYIKSYDLESNKIDIVTRTRPGSEDFELLPGGRIIMAEESKIYSINPETDEYWTEIIDLAEFNIMNITRLASSRNRLILVDTPSK